MATTDDLRAWLYGGLDELRRESDDRDSEQWTERLLELLGVPRAEDHPVTKDLVQDLENLTESDRAELLTSRERQEAMADDLGRRHGEAEPADDDVADAAAADGGQYDPDAWMTFLVANGPTWDGTEANWSAFRVWLAYEAHEQGVGQPITDLLDHLEAMGPDERVAELARYGVTIHSAGSSDALGPQDPYSWVRPDHVEVLAATWGPEWTTHLDADLAARWGTDWNSHPAEHKSAWLGDLVAAGELSRPGGTSDDVEPSLIDADKAADAEMDKLMAEVGAVPGIDDLTEDEIAVLVNHYLSEAAS